MLHHLPYFIALCLVSIYVLLDTTKIDFLNYFLTYILQLVFHHVYIYSRADGNAENS